MNSSYKEYNNQGYWLYGAFCTKVNPLSYKGKDILQEEKKHEGKQTTSLQKGLTKKKGDKQKIH